MERVRIPRQGWILVCDGAKAQILRNDGEATRLDLKPVEDFALPQAPARELGTDRPGRVYESHGTSRSALEQTDWHEQNEIDFLSDVADVLDKEIKHYAVKSLIVIAPPKALGVLRERLSPAARGIVTAEIDKDFMKLPVKEIAARLSA
ncbi:host attachment protein [Beijerinckia indica]|uniref:Host attachment protein n=1 Tax=Beijerinckia indica subsp. indica (strain ATCC 9039 / DSM 1715 / NCIMB 8712) TaxID=395963 RepID=B2IJH8_BEII9|nr:host attachment protein [Beijerinckia indica]ACB96291.1 conserved hypothetical protein [Beijerinckia indica subsp. indica ATCC 9039]